MFGGRVKTVALSQNDLICVSTAKRQKIVIFIVTSELPLLVRAFYLVKCWKKATFLYETIRVLRSAAKH